MNHEPGLSETMKLVLTIGFPIIAAIGGFLVKQLLVWRKNRVQAVTVIELQNIPIIQQTLGKEFKIINGGGKEYRSIQYFRFELTNTTLTKDLENFDILFEFEKEAVVIGDTVEKQSKLHEITRAANTEPNEAKYRIDLLNRKDKICFKFQIANTTYNTSKIHFKVPSVVLMHKRPTSVSPKIQI